MTLRGQRIVLGLLLLVGLSTGLWAVLAPRSFYDSFPTSSMHWVASDGPYNRHLIVDLGSMYLALATLVAGALLRPAVTRLAGLVFLVFSVPHWLYHTTHLDPYATRDRVINEVGLVAVIVLAALLCVPRDRWSTRPPRRTTEVDSGAR
jgi:hypothetical protein